MRLYDRLFTVPNPAAEDDFTTVLNDQSLVVISNAKLEPSLLNAEVEQGYQFERTGYFCKDAKSDSLVFNQTVGLRDSWSKEEKNLI